MARKPYPSDVTDDEWAFVAPYLTLMREDAPQREHPLRELFNGVRYVARAGCTWRMTPNDLPPWHAIYEQAQRWIRAGVFEAVAKLPKAYGGHDGVVLRCDGQDRHVNRSQVLVSVEETGQGGVVRGVTNRTEESEQR